MDEVYLAEYFSNDGGLSDDFVERGIFHKEEDAINFLINIVNKELDKKFKSWPEMYQWFKVYETTPNYLWNDQMDKEYPSDPGQIFLKKNSTILEIPLSFF